MNEFDVICCIVNSGQGSKVLRIAKNHGVKGGTIFMGKGTVRSKLLEFLDLNDIRKEIVLMAADSVTALAAAKALDKEMAFRKPNHGIAFSLPLNGLFGTKNHEFDNNSEDRVVKDTVYNAIFTIVEKGRGDEVVEASKKAGARGATIINARGSGIHETGVLFAMPIEPEKEVVLILAETGLRDAIISVVRKDLQIDAPGNGIIFSVEVKGAFGLYNSGN